MKQSTGERAKGRKIMKIVNVKEYQGGIESAIAYIHDKWGSRENYDF